jgi:hypothetical protein
MEHSDDVHDDNRTISREMEKNDYQVECSTESTEPLQGDRGNTLPQEASEASPETPPGGGEEASPVLQSDDDIDDNESEDVDDKFDPFDFGDPNQIANGVRPLYLPIAFIFMLVAITCSTTMYTPPDSQSWPMGNAGILRYKAGKWPHGGLCDNCEEVIFFFGLNRMIAQSTYPPPTDDVVGYRRLQDHGSDDYSSSSEPRKDRFYKVFDYDVCRTWNDTMGMETMSTELCQSCYTSNSAATGLLITSCVLLFAWMYAMCQAMPPNRFPVEHEVVTDEELEAGYRPISQEILDSNRESFAEDYFFTHCTIMGSIGAYHSKERADVLATGKITNVSGFKTRIAFQCMIHITILAFMYGGVALYNQCITEIKNEYQDDKDIRGGSTSPLLHTTGFLIWFVLYVEISIAISMLRHKGRVTND